MKKMMKLTALLLALAVTMSLAACGEKKTEDPAEPAATAEDGLERGFGLVEDFEETAELDEQPDRAISRGTEPVLQNVVTKLDGTCTRGDAYLYRNLLSDTYKQAYDVIRAGLVEGKTEITMTVPVPKADLQRIYRSVFYDGPDLLWVDGGYNYSYNNFGDVTKVKPKYNDLVNDLAGNRAKMEAAVKDALADMWTLGDPTAQVKYAHDYLISTVDYDLNSTYSQTAFSALVNHKSVCAGYSRAFQYMMQKVGIRCGYIVGVSNNAMGSGNHAWNIVELDGEFYAMDVTWDDPIGAQPGKFYYDYFNITDQSMASDHSRNDPSTALPTATGTAKSFSAAFGGNKYGTDFNAINGKLPEGYGSASTAFIGGGSEQKDISSNPYLA